MTDTGRQPPPRPSPISGMPHRETNSSDLNVSDEVTAVSDAATELIERQAEIHKRSALGLSKTKSALSQVEEAAIQAALIAAGGGAEAVAAGNAAVNYGPGSSGAGAAVTISQVQSPDRQLDNANSRQVQAISASVGVIFNLIWLTYLGTNLPPELYAAIPVLVQVGLQGLATHLNTRK